jgi:hypothetical protein
MTSQAILITLAPTFAFWLAVFIGCAVTHALDVRRGHDR